MHKTLSPHDQISAIPFASASPSPPSPLPCPCHTLDARTLAPLGRSLTRIPSRCDPRTCRYRRSRARQGDIAGTATSSSAASTARHPNTRHGVNTTGFAAAWRHSATRCVPTPPANTFTRREVPAIPSSSESRQSRTRENKESNQERDPDSDPDPDGDGDPAPDRIAFLNCVQDVGASSSVFPFPIPCAWESTPTSATASQPLWTSCPLDGTSPRYAS
mmetsp:Transcript_7303/g.18713  ORF Transcript_7303/g.18713 Transcript_7303/m.18713 type:complete len:218 (-) Transcript_7303:106-759(-)